MTKVRRDQNVLSLDSLLQQLRDIIRTTSISIDQQQDIILAVSEILQACTKTINIPLHGSDIQEVCGQNAVKRALEVAAAGGHNILLIGPKGAGKTVLARAFPSLLPKHTKPYPFRSPDASIDKEVFMGTPNLISPGELVLAHKGVLLMENLPAFELPLLVALRQAVEQHVVVLSEGERHIYFPAHFALVATMEPDPCGFYGISEKKCK